MKKMLLWMLLLVTILGGAFSFSACTPTPDGGGVEETPGSETPSPDETPSTEETPSTDDKTPPAGEETPTLLDALAGKTAEELYLGVYEYISALRNFTIEGGEKITKSYPDGTQTAEEMKIAMKYAVSTFDIDMLETADGQQALSMRVVYDGVSVYVDMGEDLRYKAKMSQEEFLASFGEDMPQTSAEYLPFSVFSTVGLYKDGESYYLDMKGDPAKLTEEQLETLVAEDAALTGFTYRVYLDATGKLLSEETVVEYTVIEDRKTVSCVASSSFTLFGVGTTQVVAPENADDYLDMDEEVDPDEPGGTIPAPDYNQTFTVTFKYIDTLGRPLADKLGRTETVKTVKYGRAVSAPASNDATIFDNYVIVGWRHEHGYEMDEWDFSYVIADMTVYSVVREKEDVYVSFYRSNGELFYTDTVKEGERYPLESLPPPVEIGKRFLEWRFRAYDDVSTPNYIMNDCDFIAVTEAVADGTVGKVAENSIRVDGKRDYAYTESGAYLALNTKRQADAEITAAKDTAHGGDRAVPTVTADSYVLWDGEYIYVLIEVSDKTLAGRSEAYAKNGIDAWLNDGVELRYYFEQGSSATRNHTRVGVDALGVATYALGRSEGIGGGRSTHYDGIEYAVRNALTSFDADLSRTGYRNNDTWTSVEQANGEAEPMRAPSYIVEFKIPAKTEGRADITHPEVRGLTGSAFDEFLATGLLPGRDPASDDPDDYAFTDGDDLQAGDVIRLSLQVNDLAIGYAEMTGAVGTYFWDNPSLEKILEDFPAFDATDSIHKTLLFATDGNGRITGMANTYGKFSAAGATQRDLAYYVSFALGEDTQGGSLIYGMDVDHAGKTVFYSDKECTKRYYR